MEGWEEKGLPGPQSWEEQGCGASEWEGEFKCLGEWGLWPFRKRDVAGASSQFSFLIEPGVVDTPAVMKEALYFDSEVVKSDVASASEVFSTIMEVVRRFEEGAVGEEVATLGVELPRLEVGFLTQVFHWKFERPISEDAKALEASRLWLSRSISETAQGAESFYLHQRVIKVDSGSLVESSFLQPEKVLDEVAPVQTLVSADYSRAKAWDDLSGDWPALSDEWENLYFPDQVIAIQE